MLQSLDYRCWVTFVGSPVDCKKLDYGFGVFFVAVSLFLWLGIRGLSYSNFLAYTVVHSNLDPIAMIRPPPAGTRTCVCVHISLILIYIYNYIYTCTCMYMYILTCTCTCTCTCTYTIHIPIYTHSHTHTHTHTHTHAHTHARYTAAV